LLTGITTGQGRGERSGDAPSRERQITEISGYLRPGPKPKGLLARNAEKRPSGRPDKNGMTPTGKEPPDGSGSRLERESAKGLVAGNVTGGGGKATTTKT